MNAVKISILQRRRDHEKTIGSIAAYQLAKIINLQTQGSNIEGDEIILAIAKRFNHTA
jgi:hypothetical protein